MLGAKGIAPAHRRVPGEIHNTVALVSSIRILFTKSTGLPRANKDNRRTEGSLISCTEARASSEAVTEQPRESSSICQIPQSTFRRQSKTSLLQRDLPNVCCWRLSVITCAGREVFVRGSRVLCPPSTRNPCPKHQKQSTLEHGASRRFTTQMVATLSVSW